MRTARHRVYQHYFDQRIRVVEENDKMNLNFCNLQSYEVLQREGLDHIHLGLLMVRVYALHRRDAGTLALVVLRDTRWTDDNSIIGTTEIDLSTRTQLVYFVPDMMLSIHDFHRHIELSILTKGYDRWQGGEFNLLITRTIVGRLSNTCNTAFNYAK